MPIQQRGRRPTATSLLYTGGSFIRFQNMTYTLALGLTCTALLSCQTTHLKGAS